MIERLFENDRIISDARREEIAKPLSEALRKRLGYQDPPPDPRNPHTYFSGQGLKHTKFLLRILKTFSTDLPAEKEQPRKGGKRSREAVRITAADVTGALS